MSTTDLAGLARRSRRASTWAQPAAPMPAGPAASPGTPQPRPARPSRSQLWAATATTLPATTGGPITPTPPPPASPRRRPRLRTKALPKPTKPTTTPLALRAIDGHLVRTATQVVAWYRLAPQAWSFRGNAPREQLIARVAAQLGDLEGRWLHLRVTSRPYPVPQWAQAFDANARDRPADRPGALSYRDFLRGEQHHLHSKPLADKQVYLGVEVSGRRGLDRLLDRAAPLLARFVPGTLDAELTALDSEVRHLDAILAGAGLDARPVSAEEMSWLVHRSVRLGLPAPVSPPAVTAEGWQGEDLASFTDRAHMIAEPYDPTLQVIGTVDGQLERRHLVVLTLGQMAEMSIPQWADPWMLPPDRLPFPVEWSARMYVRASDEVTGELQRQMGKVRSQERHYTHDHNLDPPLALERQSEQVRLIEDELAAGLTHTSTRLYGWWRIAVSGESEEHATDRARAVVEAFKPLVAVEHPDGAYRLAREFIPGEPLASTAHRRRGSVTWAAAAMPSVTATIGDHRGILLGETHSASRVPVAWDPWTSQERHRGSGLTAIVGGLGSGKSTLTGLIVYKSLRAGARWTVLDPSGPLAKLTTLPELAPYSRHIHLLHAEPGILNPYRVVAQPRLDQFADEPDPEHAWRRERRLADATRRRLVLDVLSGLLPHDVARMPATRIALLRAVRHVGGAPSSHPGMVIDTLREHAGLDAHASALADFLAERRELPQAALLFPVEDHPVDPWADDADIRLTVLTMQGLPLPRPGSPREDWTDTESLGVELLNLASWLTQRTVYDADRDLRKGVALDETHFLSQIPTGKLLIDRLARDSRKFNLRALFASQLAGDLLRVSGFASLLDAVFVGRTDDEAAQLEALRLLRIPTDPEYSSLLGSLSPRHHHGGAAESRQFVFADGNGGVETISIDLAGPHLRHLRAALDTNPNGHRARTNATAIAPAATRALPGPDPRGAASRTAGTPSLPARRPTHQSDGEPAHNRTRAVTPKPATPDPAAPDPGERELTALLAQLEQN